MCQWCQIIGITLCIESIWMSFHGWQVLEDGCQVECRASTTSSTNADEEIRTEDRSPTTPSSLASYRHTQRTPKSPSAISTPRPNDSPSSSLSSHSQCSCSCRVTDIRAFSGFHSDGDVDDAVAMETRQRLQRSLRSTTSEGGGAFRRVLPSHDNGGAPTTRESDVTHSVDKTRESGEWVTTAEDDEHGCNMRSSAAKPPQNGHDYSTQNRPTANNRAKEMPERRRADGSNWLNGIDSVRTGSDWVCADAQRHRRRRKILSVVKSGAGLRAISETGDTCRLAPAAVSLAPDVSHPVIRGLYAQRAPVPASTAVVASLASSSSSLSSASSAAAAVAAESATAAALDESSSDNNSQHSIWFWQLCIRAHVINLLNIIGTLAKTNAMKWFANRSTYRSYEIRNEGRW